MKRFVSIILTIVMVACLSVTNVFATDTFIRLSPEFAEIIAGSATPVNTTFNMELVGEPEYGESVKIEGATGDTSIKIKGEVDLSKYSKITISYGNDGPIGKPLIDTKIWKMSLKVGETVIGEQQVMPGAEGWKSTEIAELSFPINSTLKGEVVIFVSNHDNSGVQFYEATFSEKAAVKTTGTNTSASPNVSTSASVSASVSPATSPSATKTTMVSATPSVKTSATLAVNDGEDADNKWVLPVIIGSIILVAAAATVVIIIKKKK